MKQLRYILPFFLVLFAQSASAQVCEEESEERHYQLEVVEEPIKEVFNEDGTYIKRRGNEVIATGHHVNRKLDGEIKKLSNGRPVQTTTYKIGVKHGPEVDYMGGFTVSRSYENGVLVGYVTDKKTSGQLNSQFGPYFTGKTKKHVFVAFERFELGNGYESYRYDSIFLEANRAPEIHRLYFTKKYEVIIDTEVYAHCKLPLYQSDEYTIDRIESIMQDWSYGVTDFDYQELEKPKELVLFASDGSVKARAFPGYWISFYSNGQLKDSMFSSGGTDYCHYRWDDQGNIVFKGKKEIVNKGSYGNVVFRWTNDFFLGNEVQYSISSVNGIPERVFSAKPKVLEAIKSGKFTDVYGTLYITDQTGNIDTSFVKELIPLRYTNDIKPGRYYYLYSVKPGIVETVEVTAKKVCFQKLNISDLTPVGRPDLQKIIFQKDSVYQLYTSLGNAHYARKLMQRNGKLYSIDWQKDNGYAAVLSIEELIVQAHQDSLIDSYTPMLTEAEFQAALKRRNISGMPKETFMTCIDKLEVIRMNERKLLEKVRDKNTTQLMSPKLFLVFYEAGFNPYFSEKEFWTVINSYRLTAAEEARVKQIIRLKK